MWVSSDLATSLVYWENPRESGIAFGSVLVCLLAVRYISLIRDVQTLMRKCCKSKCTVAYCLAFTHEHLRDIM